MAWNRGAVARSYVLTGLSYPFWSLLTPGSTDPFGIWLGIGAAFLAIGAAALWNLSRATLNRFTVVLAGAVTLHLFLLASINDMHPFYAVGSSMAVVTTVLFIRSMTWMAAYCGFVTVLAAALYAAEPDSRKLAYWAGPIPVLIFAYHRLTVEIALERRLEDQVSERTLQLAETNQRLRDEIEARTLLEKDLRVQHKVEAVGRLAGAVAHDFNNLLTTIGVYAELLLEGLPEGSPLLSEVHQIQQAQHQAAGLTQQLLTLGRRSHVELQVLDLSEVISGMSSLLRYVLSGHEIVLSLGDGRHPIRANDDQLQQIVLNLATNARDAMTEPGRLTIETTRPSRGALAKSLGVKVDGEYVQLTVTDTGTGMSAETRDRAFDPFFSTKPPDRGSGLGLSILHGIVSQAGGHVRLISEPGSGARFELYWPVAEKPTERERIRNPRVEATTRSANILLVEDEDAIRLALVRVLTTAGYRVTEANDGAQALETVQRTHTNFDLVITDVVMPLVSGFELTERLAQTQPGAKILLISGHLSERTLRSWDGRIAFLAKPFAPVDLLKKVGDVLAYAPISS